MDDPIVAMHCSLSRRSPRPPLTAPSPIHTLYERQQRRAGALARWWLAAARAAAALTLFSRSLSHGHFLPFAPHWNFFAH